jgi:hypothetical protein
MTPHRAFPVELEMTQPAGDVDEWRSLAVDGVCQPDAVTCSEESNLLGGRCRIAGGSRDGHASAINLVLPPMLRESRTCAPIRNRRQQQVVRYGELRKLEWVSDYASSAPTPPEMAFTLKQLPPLTTGRVRRNGQQMRDEDPVASASRPQTRTGDQIALAPSATSRYVRMRPLPLTSVSPRSSKRYRARSRW